jgi:hypothetical protein
MQSTTDTSNLAFLRVLISRTVLRTAFAVATMFLAVASGIAQSDEAKTKAEKPTTSEQTARQPKLTFTLKVTTDQIIGISLKADDVKLKEIAGELSRKLKIPVMLTPIVERHAVTVNFSDVVLETAMQMLAPQVYIDYEVDSTPGTQPRPLAIYLQGYNERPPSDTAVVKSNSDVMIVEGNTEDDGTDKNKDEKEQGLKVTVKDGLISVNARKQPLVVVLYGIANELGIPFEVRNEVTDVVTTTINGASVESALQQLGPNIRLYLRYDLQLGERRPLRLLLVGGDKKS